MLTALQEANIRAVWGKIIDDGLVVEPGAAHRLDFPISPQWASAEEAFSGDDLVRDEIVKLHNNLGTLNRNFLFDVLQTKGAELPTQELGALIYSWGVGSIVGKPNVDDDKIQKAVNQAVWPQISPVIARLQNSDVLSVSDYEALMNSPTFGGAKGINIGYASKFFYFLELTMNLGKTDSLKPVKCLIYDSQVRGALEKKRDLAGSIFGPTMWFEPDSSRPTKGRWRVPETPNYWDYLRYCQALEIMAEVTSEKLDRPVEADDIEARLYESGSSF